MRPVPPLPRDDSLLERVDHRERCESSSRRHRRRPRRALAHREHAGKIVVEGVSDERRQAKKTNGRRVGTVSKDPLILALSPSRAFLDSHFGMTDRAPRRLCLDGRRRVGLGRGRHGHSRRVRDVGRRRRRRRRRSRHHHARRLDRARRGRSGERAPHPGDACEAARVPPARSAGSAAGAPEAREERG